MGAKSNNSKGTTKDWVPVHWALKGIRERATRSQIHWRMRTKDLGERPQQPEQKIVLWKVIQPNCWVLEVDPLLFLPLEKPRETTSTICWTSDGGIDIVVQTADKPVEDPADEAMSRHDWYNPMNTSAKSNEEKLETNDRSEQKPADITGCELQWSAKIYPA